jgi:hypothetical protein
MVRIFCGAHHGGSQLCPECAALLAYAEYRLERCPFQGDKPTCAACPVHCYRPAQRQRIRQVMRFSGPRMLWRHPYLALRHLLDGRRDRRAKPLAPVNVGKAKPAGRGKKEHEEPWTSNPRP